MYQPVIGLEIHVELNTKSKMFCGCANDSDEHHPNILICPTCLGHPGSLPVINKEAVRKTIKTGLSLNCQIPEYSKFDRRLYFYPDLPKGYQISQWKEPLCKGGFLEIEGKKIRIKEIHLEEDVGRLVHERDYNPPTASSRAKGAGPYSLVDFNRAGVPLMELDTEPDMRSAKEARKFAEELQLIVRYLGVSSAFMEKGEMRCDANISLTKTKKLGTKVEIKNLNSFKAIEQGLEYEIKRQTEILNSGEKITQETRGWDDDRGVTVPQREKGEAIFSPEPNLPILHLGVADYINEIRAEIPELPRQRRERFKKEYHLDEKSIEIFVQNKDFGEYFEKVVSEFGPRLSQEKLSGLIKLATNYLITDLQGLLKGASVTRVKRRVKMNERSSTVGEDFLITPENFAEFITLIYRGAISSKIAKQVLAEMFSTGADPSHIIEEKGLSQITDEAEIGKIIKEVISKNSKAVQDFKKGKETAIQFLIGQIMTQTKGKANPQIVRNILNKQLTSTPN